MRRRRRGITLMEVLISILVMGIGLVAVASLFPVGLVAIRQAIRDQRSVMLARSAKAQLEVRRDLDLSSNTELLHLLTGQSDASLSATYPILPAGTARTWLTDPANPVAGPSYPVLVDPMGASAGTSWGIRTHVGYFDAAVWPGGPDEMTPPDTTEQIDRFDARAVNHPLAFATPTAAFEHLVGSMDDMVYYPPQSPSFPGPVHPDSVPPTQANIVRDHLYSWTTMVRLAESSTVNVVEVCIAVYNRRTLVADAERAYPAQRTGGSQFSGPGFTNEDNPDTQQDERAQVVITWPQASGVGPPDVPIGGYVLDATNQVGDDTDRRRNGYYYRVIGRSDVGVVAVGGTSYLQQTLYLENPARAKGTVAVFPKGLVEVFEHVISY